MVAQGGRINFGISKDWLFTKEDPASPAAKWTNVNLPHTWNVEDVMDDKPGYYRGPGWYKKLLSIDPSWQGKEIYLYFEGANQVTTVWINGQKAGEHTGGYTAFYIPLSKLARPGGVNELLVRADNSHNNNIPPLSADFTFYGGVYRDVWLVAVDPVHFSCSKDGSSGVFINTPSVDSWSGLAHIRTHIVNESLQSRTVRCRSTILSSQGRTVSSCESLITLAPSSTQEANQELKVRRPKLWSPENPCLYIVRTQLTDAATGELLDISTNRTGFRWFHFDPEKGFFLNGKPYKLVGTSRHQDYKGLGNAVPDELAVKDVALLKAMGGNFLRVAHYPQDMSVINACDSLGILASVEIPVVNEITESDTFSNNCVRMQQEMIRQYYNHSSVIIWCYMNEVLLRSHYNDDNEKQKQYYAAITRLARALDSTTRNEDPYRYTMIAHHGDYKRYRDIGLVDIPMIVGWNLYSGWYGADLSDFPLFLDAFHKDYPAKPMVVSEYGADADPRVRSLEPVRFDKSVEYTTDFHRYYIHEMLRRPFVAAAMIWNLADFNSETRTESMPHINNKGLVEWDRRPKDPYYYYQALLSRKPFVKVLGAVTAAGVAKGGAFCIRPVSVATNLPELEMFANGKSLGVKKASDGLCEWKVPFVNGVNTIEATGLKNGITCSDRDTVQFTLQPALPRDSAVVFHQLNVLLGANRYFTDCENKVWIPDQEYYPGSWGHIGGKIFQIPNSGKLPYGTDKNIAGTFDDPIYQTQQIGIQQYKLDLPKGEYEIVFHFAELLGGQVKEVPYNLSDPGRIEPNGKRVFDVYVNDKLILEKFDIAGQYGSSQAVLKKVNVTVSDDRGIEISFQPIQGEPVLNALQVTRIESDVLQVGIKH